MSPLSRLGSAAGYDATNVLRSRVVLLTNVGLEHTDVLGDTLEAIATEKLAVAPADSVVVLPDDTYAHLVPGRAIRHGGACEAAEAFVGHPIAATPDVSLPGRFERRGGEIRDGAHNPDGARHLLELLDRDDYTVVASVLADKDVDAMLRALSRAGSRLVATASSSARALPATDLAELARRYFDQVEVVDDPVAALARAHELGEPVLVTGSLYLLAISRRPSSVRHGLGDGATHRARVRCAHRRGHHRHRVRRRVRDRQASAMTNAVPLLQLSLDIPTGPLSQSRDRVRRGSLARDGLLDFKDARRRIEDPWLVGLATLVGLFPPFLGPIIYMFFRPPEYLQDARERELEIKAMEERLAQLDMRCPVCRAKVEPSATPSAPSAPPVCARRVPRADSRSTRCAGLPVLRHGHPARGFHRSRMSREPSDARG